MVVRVLLAGLCLVPLLGCEPLAMSLVGAGTSFALAQNYNGVAHRTFTAPPAHVKAASVAALGRMGIALERRERYEGGEILHATAENRSIQIEIEPVSERATRVRIAASNGGFFHDTATASEIIAQTEKTLEARAVNNVTKGTRRVTSR